MKNLTNRTEWLALTHHYQHIENQHMRDWFSADKERFSRFTLQASDIFLDYSRNRITDHTVQLLCTLANAIQLPQKIEALFTGHPINTSQNRPALHTALRDTTHTPILIDGVNIATLIAEAQQKMRDCVANIHAQEWRGVTGKPIMHVVNIGIGGSYLGPMMGVHALKDYAISPLQFHFISTVDHAHLHEVLQLIDAETTLFIVSSKSFTTLETMTNAYTVLRWMQDKLGDNVLAHHFIAITAAAEKAIAFGIPENHIFPLWDWVGGRYSIWSPIGLPLMLMVGQDHFMDFLEGAHEMDKHFRTMPFDKNMPVLLALLGIWYMNFFGTNVHAIIPYAHRLRYLIAYLQQAEMESNGKSTSLSGSDINYSTGPVIFGEEGCNGQHAYHQLLHQGKHLIPVDFVLVGKSLPLKAPKASSHLKNHQDILIASALSQAQALMRGKTHAEATHELMHLTQNEQHTKALAQHYIIPGNRPSNILFIERITPKSLGALIALYEHKVFVQGAIWDINSFDQWGVELGKQLLPDILRQVQGTETSDNTDSATLGLIHHFRKMGN